MPRVTVPKGKDPLVHVWTELAPSLTAAAGAYSTAVYEKSSLSLREFEAARITIARINQCAICIDWRTGDAAALTKLRAVRLVMADLAFAARHRQDGAVLVADVDDDSYVAVSGRFGHHRHFGSVHLSSSHTYDVGQ